MMRQPFGKIHLALSTVVILLAVSAPGVAAISSAQQNLYRDGINFFSQDTIGCSVTLGSTSLLGGDNPTKIWNYLKQKGLSDIAAAGVMGNLQQESGFSTTATDGVAHGIAQWQDARFTALQNFASAEGKSWTDLGAQLDYLYKEISPGGNRSQTLPDLQKSTDVTSLTVGVGSTYSFEMDFEGANQPVMTNRINNAQQALSKYGSGSVGAAGVSTSAVSGGNCGTGGSTYSGSGFPLYSQCDPKWGNHPYWGDNICGSGCGPTSMAMIITALTGQNVTPDVVADFFTSRGLEGSWGGAAVAAQHWGLQSQPLGTDVAKISAAVQSGSLVIMAGRGGLPFTSAGHFVVVRGVTSDGQWILGDPDTAPGHSNTKPWDPTTVIAGVINNGGAASVVAISK